METGQYITDGNVTWIVTDTRDGNQVGDIVYKPYLADGYVKANGATVLRADYPRLVNLANQHSLWTDNPSSYKGLFGVGDGSTTMVLPDLRGRVLWGGDSSGGMSIEAGLPNIEGSFKGYNTKGGYMEIGRYGDGALYPTLVGTSQNTSGASPGQYTGIAFDASRSNSIYGSSTTVQPPAINMIVQIKY